VWKAKSFLREKFLKLYPALPRLSRKKAGWGDAASLKKWGEHQKRRKKKKGTKNISIFKVPYII
jgi:hypothetical protein